jgi:hypothetical protein
MMDLDRVQELYDLQTSPSATPEEQKKAKDRIAQITDTVVEEYLASLVHETDGGGAFVGRKKGTRKFESYEVLWARNCLEGRYVYGHGGIDECPPVEDKVGNVLFHRRYTQRSE